MYDIIIIGGGVAGMTAALYAARNGLKSIILEKYIPGGQIVNTLDVENYPGFKSVSGFDLSNSLRDQVLSFGVEIKLQDVIEINLDTQEKIVKTKKCEYKSKSVIIATGCVPKKMGCENESSFEGRGISYCATCDGHFFKDKDVCVVGGGNTALEDAIYLSSICKTVYIIHRRQEFRGDSKTLELLKQKENVKFVLDSIVKSVDGQGMLGSITVTNKNTGENKCINVNGAFVAIGQIPHTELFKDIIDIDSNGYIISDENCNTKIKGVFVAGDVRTKKVRQLITAASDGAVSASEAFSYISGI